MSMIMAAGMAPAFDPVATITATTSLAQTIVGALMGLVGVIGMFVVIYRVGQKFLGSDESRQHKWGMLALGFIFFAALFGGGWALIASAASGSQNTVSGVLK